MCATNSEGSSRVVFHGVEEQDPELIGQEGIADKFCEQVHTEDERACPPLSTAGSRQEEAPAELADSQGQPLTPREVSLPSQTAEIKFAGDSAMSSDAVIHRVEDQRLELIRQAAITTMLQDEVHAVDKCVHPQVIATSSDQHETMAAHAGSQQGKVQNTMPDSGKFKDPQMPIGGCASLSSEDDDMPCIGFVSQRVSVFTKLSSSNGVHPPVTTTSFCQEATLAAHAASQQGEVKNTIPVQQIPVEGCDGLSSEFGGMPSTGCVSQRVAVFTKCSSSKCMRPQVTPTSFGQQKTAAAHAGSKQCEVQKTMLGSDEAKEQQMPARECASLNSHFDEMPSSGCVSQRVSAFSQLSSSTSQSLVSVADAPSRGLVSERIRVHQQFICGAAA